MPRLYKVLEHIYITLTHYLVLLNHTTSTNWWHLSLALTSFNSHEATHCLFVTMLHQRTHLHLWHLVDALIQSDKLFLSYFIWLITKTLLRIHKLILCYTTAAMIDSGGDDVIPPTSREHSFTFWTPNRCGILCSLWIYVTTLSSKFFFCHNEQL